MVEYLNFQIGFTANGNLTGIVYFKELIFKQNKRNSSIVTPFIVQSKNMRFCRQIPVGVVQKRWKLLCYKNGGQSR